MFCLEKSLMQGKKAAQFCLKQKMEKRCVDTRKRSGVLMVTKRRPCSISRRLLKPLQMTGIITNMKHVLHNLLFCFHIWNASSYSVFCQHYSWRVRSVPMGNRRMIIKKKKISLAEDYSQVHKIYSSWNKALV